MKDIEKGLMHKALLVGSGSEGIYTNFKVTKVLKTMGKERERKKKGRERDKWKGKGEALPVAIWVSL